MSTFAGNNSSTSAVNITVVEDLGGGMKATGFIETNPNMNGSGTADGVAFPLAGTAGMINGDSSAAFGNGQRFVGLSGASWGGVKLGAANSAILGTIAGVAQPFGTALGGGYSSSFSMVGIGAGTRVIRTPNSARYDSPSFGGFAVSYELAFNNKNAAGTTDVSTGVSVLGATYSAGPLNVAFVTGAATNGAANNKDSQFALAANYAFGATTVYAGMTEGKSVVAGADNGKSSSLNFAIKHVMGNVALMANTVSRKDKTTGVVNPADGSLLGLGMDYSLSKRTTAYARYENFDTTKASDAAGKRTAYSAGIRHTF